MSATKQLKDVVFSTALDLTDPLLRKSFLDQICADDPALRTEVEEMLSAQGEAERFFAKGQAALFLAADEVQTTAPPDLFLERNILDEQVGTRIGRYKLRQKIGEGGCGVVYLAEQAEPIRRRVALKIIKLGMDTKSVIARFEAERQALALMDHPNIARALDAGATDLGRPYFVMEWVQGTKVNEYCDQNQLDTRTRLRLFIQICHAIQHAHQKGIIHRDIKPSNVMVTLHDAVPVPKVIDFGIAKATDGRLTDHTFFTACEQFIGTPAYMSPEQAERGRLDIDTRSDIYSLGVLLYELLAGRTPFDGKKMVESGVEGMRQTLREMEPPTPSAMVSTLPGEELTKTAGNRRTEPAKLIGLLRGDLDWIVMKALEKDRARRYQTANGLALDVQRYLDSEPVTARPPNQFYRFQKLVRRNKMVFGAVAAAVVALVAGLGSSTWLFLRERAALQEQARSREAAEESAKREAELRRQAEAREQINQAAILITQQRYDAADRLLDAIKIPPLQPDNAAAAAFRLVSDLLAIHGRWKDAADRFSALVKIDKLDDWNNVTLDYQTYGTVVAESGDTDRYQRFCQEAIANFGVSTNGRADWRILKVSLLMPPDQALIASLSPLAKVAGNYFDQLPRHPGVSDPWAWGALPMALWKYRCGDFAGALNLCRANLDGENRSIIPTDRMILAMSYWQLGQHEQAQAELAVGRGIIQDKFKNGLDQGDLQQGFWWDWVFARILLREATALIEKNPPPAG